MITRSSLAHAGWLALFALLGLASFGCEDKLAKATEISHMRILGAKLEVVGDEDRATPAPGEHVRVSLATEFETLSADRSKTQMLLLGCTAPSRFTGGVPVCQELIDAAQSGTLDMAAIGLPAMLDDRFACPGAFSLELGGALSLTCAVGDPTAVLPVPPDFKADNMLFVGVLCEDGTAVIDPADPQLFGCDPPEDERTIEAEPDAGIEEHAELIHEAIRLHGVIKVDRDEKQQNHNPDMTALTLSGVNLSEVTTWEPIAPELLTPALEANCSKATESSQLPFTHDTGYRDLRLSYRADALEKEDGAPEVLELTVYVTQGEIERRFTLLRAVDANHDDGNKSELIEHDLKWTPDDFKTHLVPASGGGMDKNDKPKLMDASLPALARFIVTIRDDRGGFGMATYATCLAP